MTYTFSTGSGFLNSPPRVVLIGDDNRPGSYPVEVSPVLAAKSSEYAKPYRDDIFPDTRGPYAQAHVIFTAVPNESESITLTNAQGQAHTFTFKLTSPNFATGPTSYDVSYDELSSTPREGDEGLTRSQIVTKRALEKFVEAVNRATGSLITASPTSYYGRAILTQRIPGTTGNTANSTTSADVTIQSFTGGNAGEIRYPFGIIASGSGEVLRRVLSTAESGTLDVPAAGNASLLTAYSDGHPYAVFQPYDESNSQQAFGIATGGSSEYGTQTQLYDDFFTRGSTLGNLDEPLSAKDKIVIDLTPNSETSLLSTTGSSIHGPASNFPMAYFNFSTKRWEPIGFGYGRTTPAGVTTLQENLERQYLGFSQGWQNAAVDSSTNGIQILDPELLRTYTGTKKVFQESGWFSPIDTFGFPLHPKYHATGSQQLDVTSLIDRPFLIEKIVYEFSGSMPHLQSTLGGGNFYLGGGGVFFILNQRKANPDPGQENEYTNTYISERTGREFGTPQDGGVDGPNGSFYSFHYQNGGIPRTMQLSPSGPSVYVDSIRDLVTFARVGTIWDTYGEEIEQLIEPNFPHPARFMDLAINVPATGTFSGKYTVAAPVRSPSQNFAIANIELGTPSVSPNNTVSVWASKDSSTRNSIDIPTGRAYRGDFFGPEIAYRTAGYNTTKFIFAPKFDNVESPYLILPGDRLVFGWQSPMSYAINSIDKEKTLKILPGAGKLTLYGSYLQNDKPVHDIYKDQLNSDAAHETLPAGPWVLDRFETEPQMCYSSSMREEHVTGTMVTRNASGGLAVTSVNDFSIGGVRSTSARVSDGNVGQRWSFFRNNRLFDSEEQYYDSMQPNPLKIFEAESNIKLYAGYTDIDPFLLIKLPGETYIHDSAPSFATEINNHSNSSWVGSFPFEEKYDGIERVKNINSRTLSGQKYESFNGIGGTLAPQNPKYVMFVTGTIGTKKSNLIRAGGLSKNSVLNPSFGWIVPISSFRQDTNPVVVSPGNEKYEIQDLPFPSTTVSVRYYGIPLFYSLLDQIYNFSNLTNYHFSRFTGCFGNGHLGLVQYNSFPTADLLGLPFFSDGSAKGMIYRGVKHGLINPVPLFSNAVFSGTRYGQLRDMMEQRQYTRFSLANNTLTDAAVSVQFINRSASPGTLNITSGSATNSSNISKFATSEHPYDDAISDFGQIWDRDEPLPETLIAL
jgi:hypothetical protein